MLSFQQEFQNFLLKHKIAFQSNTESFNELDFDIFSSVHQCTFRVELKEKRQKYVAKDWSLTDEAERFIFIVDDLSIRKILKHAPLSGLLIRDITTNRFHFYSVVDLMLIPKKRMNRNISKTTLSLKGKWLINLGDSYTTPNLKNIIDHISDYIENQKTIFIDTLECFGHYQSEQIGISTSVREKKYWNIDVDSTK
jgi:hypothetical protein